MPVAAEIGQPLEQWALKRSKIMRLELEPPDWIALQLLAVDRHESLGGTLSAMVHDRLVEKAALIAELRESV